MVVKYWVKSVIFYENKFFKCFCIIFVFNLPGITRIIIAMSIFCYMVYRNKWRSVNCILESFFLFWEGEKSMTKRILQISKLTMIYLIWLNVQKLRKRIFIFILYKRIIVKYIAKKIEILCRWCEFSNTNCI